MVAKWEFDEDIANRFNGIAVTNIPNYLKVINKCVAIANKHIPKDGKVIDIGCAVGTTLRLFEVAGFTNLYGVDASDAMLNKCKIKLDNATLIKSLSFPKEVDVDMIVANWVLHFIIDPIERAEYIKNIYNALKPGGYFIITEKVEYTDISLDLYHDHKRRHGLSELEIAEKDAAIDQILVPLPLSFYTDTLGNLFKHVEIIDADFCFVTFMAQK